jgi:hypothetical protein
MRRLKLKSKPKSLALHEVYELYKMDAGEETPEFIIRMLDLSYPRLNRDEMDIFEKMDKYREAKAAYSVFQTVIKGMVGNGTD